MQVMHLFRGSLAFAMMTPPHRCNEVSCGSLFISVDENWHFWKQCFWLLVIFRKGPFGLGEAAGLFLFSLSLCKVIFVWYRSSSFRCREYFSRLLIFRKLELNFVFLATSFLSSTAGMLHGYTDCELHARVVSVTLGYTTGYFMRTCLAGGGNKVLM